MKISTVHRLLAAILLSSALTGLGAEGDPAKQAPSGLKPRQDQTAAQKELQALVAKITGKMKEGKKSEKDLADELKEFDTLLASHKGEKTDDVAQILMMKAMLYVQIIEDTDKGLALVRQVKKDFPETRQGREADATITRIEQGEEARKIQRGLAVGSKFPDFAEKDLEGKPLSIAAYKGKVVLVDFWATWCGPCVKELPNVLATYEKHHANGFDIVGISLDSSEKKLKDFIAAKKMPWRQYFDGKGWESKLGGQYGVKSIPATYLLDGTGTILAKDLRGEDLEQAVAAALTKK